MYLYLQPGDETARVIYVHSCVIIVTTTPTRKDQRFQLCHSEMA